jgi:L-2,4-diaminobutyric acid acetyltransferase
VVLKNSPVQAQHHSNATHLDSIKDLTFRMPRVSDAHAIWELVSECETLDANSLYCYLLLCRDFPDTCLVGCIDEKVVALLLGYRPPHRPDSVFVWQIGVAESVRRQGVAMRLLNALWALPSCQDCRYLEATVTPSNEASLRLFSTFASQREVECKVCDGFDQKLFGTSQHESENLIRIGPIS